MLLFATLVALVAVVHAAPPMYDGRIVGGADTTIEKHPHQISLQSPTFHHCGGSIVAPKYVVTAAHCVAGSSPRQLTVRAGTTTQGKGGVVVKVADVKYNPNFSMAKLDGDVGVLTLAADLTFGEKIKSIAIIPINKEPSANEILTVTGWGATRQGAPALPKTLQEVSVPVVDKELCQVAYKGKITDTMLCAGVSKKDSCQGDSGGPLINAKRQLVGIVSWGNGCGQPGYPGVYGSVASTFINNFITKIVNATTESEEDLSEW